MSILVFFGREDKRKVGHCVSSGKKTSNRLPNGDFLWEGEVKSYRDRGWLDDRLEYTDEYFRAHKWRTRFVDANGHVHSLGISDLWDVGEEPELAAWLLANVQLSREELTASLNGAREGNRILLVELIEQALKDLPGQRDS